MYGRTALSTHVFMVRMVDPMTIYVKTLRWDIEYFLEIRFHFVILCYTYEYLNSYHSSIDFC